jgi:hypothetical protein
VLELRQVLRRDGVAVTDVACRHERGRGVADATAFAAGIEELVDATRAEGWVAEEPDAHLQPHLERTVASTPLELEGIATAADGTFELQLTWPSAAGTIRALIAAAYAVLGSIAESATYVRQRGGGGDEVVVFEVVTGMLAPDTRFAPHGHTLRLRVRRG